MKRRAFMNWVGVGFMASSLPVVIAACTPAVEEPEVVDEAEAEPCAATEPVASSAREDGFAPLGSVEELDSAGFLSDKSFAGGPVIAIRDPENADSVVAFNSTCTHQGCSVAWESSEFACPCHGSKFSASGEVTEGPATEALATYEAMIEDAQVLVRAA
ncbi:Rieske (2Fe-2S) domain protein [Synechococcus sp. PCC 7335]|uniref:QcrA and Rieske domain-containing protein n=1 Tax=Synechococcus sp. (strain ATCC 29403 / PCC 7335) TaxID=91464 RepID=UPI00017EB891|nr:Rieske (2Fe-2S) protein [Synechococcus sp. PCC 7335]EDX86626.1 Rieske (2Fe-2S) domain protein [Synechococcus sp. PCC 7335]